MIDAKKQVETTLKASTALVTLLGAKHIYTDHTTNRKQYPRIVLYEISIPDGDYMDDEPQTYEPTIQASIYSRDPTHTIFKELDKTMKAAGWRRTFGSETYEEEEMLYHRPCRYKQKYLY